MALFHTRVGFLRPHTCCVHFGSRTQMYIARSPGARKPEGVEHAWLEAKG